MDKNYFDIPDDPLKKNEIKDVLTEGEMVLVELAPNRRDYIYEAMLKGLPVTLLWAAFDVFFIIMILNTGMGNDVLWVIIPFFILHLLPVWLYFFNIFKAIREYRNIKYVFTQERIIIRSGIIGIDFKYFFYHDIDSVDVKVGILDRLFKVGDLYIKSKTDTAVLHDIDNPYHYANKIMGLTKDIKADIYFPNDLRPKENHGYKTTYTKNKDDINQ